MDKVVRLLNRYVPVGVDVWVALVCAILSVYAPKLLINGIESRNAIHVMLCGDVASLKSSVLRVVSKVSPKARIVTRSTEASLEGIGTIKGIQEGVIDKANDGVIIFPQFSRSEFTIMRELMDCTKVVIEKSGETKETDVNMSVMTDVNPTKDFWVSTQILREQLGYKEGLLSRFDVLLPFYTTDEKIREVLGKTRFMDGRRAEDVFGEVKKWLIEVAKKLKTIKTVKLTKRKAEDVRRFFLSYNRVVNGRPLVLLRDFDFLLRLINVVACVNSKGYDVVYAKGRDVNLACAIWEYVISLREKMLTEKGREALVSPKEYIYNQIIENGEVSLEKLKEVVCEKAQICKKSAFYEYLKQLRLEGKIKRNGLRNSSVVPLIHNS